MSEAEETSGPGGRPPASPGADEGPAPSAPLDGPAASGGAGPGDGREAEERAPARSAGAPERFDGEQRRLDPDWVPAERIAGWIFVGVLATGLSVGGALFVLFSDAARWLRIAGPVAAAVLLVAIAVLVHAWPPIAWRHTSYRAGERGIEIRRGVVWRSVTSVPRTRVQHTDVTQGPVQRRFGLATLVLHTAGSENSEVNLEGLARPTALALRSFLSGDGPSDDAV